MPNWIKNPWAVHDACVPLAAKTFEVPLGIGQVLKKYQNDVLKSQMDMASKSLWNTFRRFLGSVVKDFK